MWVDKQKTTSSPKAVEINGTPINASFERVDALVSTGFLVLNSFVEQ